MDRRWHVSDFQRIVIYVSVVAAVFVAAMALGWQNLWLLLAAVGVLLVMVLSVLVVAARRGSGGHEIVTARVLSVSSPPPNIGIAARCDMQLEVFLPGRSPVRTRHRDPAVPLTRWPQPGQTFPVDVLGGNPRRHLHIRWDLVEQGMVQAPDSSGARSPSGGGGGAGVVWEEENEPIIFSPTPPRPRRPQASTTTTTSPPPPPAPSAATAPPPAPAADAPAPAAAGVFLHETFTDLDEETVRTPTPPAVDQPRSPRTSPNGHDPDGIDPDDFETPQLSEAPPDPPAVTGGPGFEAVPLSDFDPAEVDIRDFSDEPPAVTAMPLDDEPPAASAPPPSATGQASPTTAAPTDEPTGPQPSDQPSNQAAPPTKPAEGATRATQPTDTGTRPIPLPRDPGRATFGGTGISATRTVAELGRSLRFYRDALGFTVAFTSTDSAVVEHQGSRVLLERGDGAPPPSGDLHVDVTDIEATCAAARDNGGEIVEPPAPSHGASGLRLWRARLRDPDGHLVEVIEWRETNAD